MKFTVRFLDGPLGNRAGEVEVDEFKVGMLMDIRGFTYEVLPGPAASLFEKKQEGHDSLACTARHYPGEQP